MHSMGPTNNEFDVRCKCNTRWLTCFFDTSFPVKNERKYDRQQEVTSQCFGTEQKMLPRYFDTQQEVLTQRFELKPEVTSHGVTLQRFDIDCSQ